MFQFCHFQFSISDGKVVFHVFKNGDSLVPQPKKISSFKKSIYYIILTDLKQFTYKHQLKKMNEIQIFKISLMKQKTEQKKMLKVEMLKKKFLKK